MKASSFSDCEDATNLGDVLAVFESVRENPKGERLGPRNGLVTSDSVREHTWKFGHLTDPATVLFALDFNVELTHVKILTLFDTRCASSRRMFSQRDPGGRPSVFCKELER